MGSALSFLAARSGDLKHERFPHPLAAAALSMLVLTALSVRASDALSPPADHVSTRDARFGKAMLAYMAAVMAVRVRTNGPLALYDLLWACNGALVLAGVGLASGRPLLVSGALVSVSIDQCMWYADVLGYVLSRGRKWPIGVAAYLSWPETTLTRKLTSSHHLWFIPLCMWLLRRSGGLAPSAFAMSTAIVLQEAALARLLVPFEIGSTYMNINLTHECWKDVKVPLLHLADHAPGPVAVPACVAYWSALNAPFYWLLAHL